MDAIEYNRHQNIDLDEIVRIQRTVGAVPDGLWGPKTIAKIVAWQREQKLDDDGRVGPKTLERFRDLWEDDDRDAPEPGDDADELGDDAGDLSVAEIQNLLFTFGFEPGAPDGHAGMRTRFAVAAFQAAAKLPMRIVGDRRVNVTVTYQGGTAGDIDASTLMEIEQWQARGYWWLPVGSEYTERRVRVANYGRIARSSRLLVDVPGTDGKPRKLHRLAAGALGRLLAEAKDAGLELLVQSGWRRHRWSSRAEYEAVLRAKYGSVERGNDYLAFDSPHETGLAVDFGTEGLYPRSGTIPAQRKTPAFAWLMTNAWRFGWRPYTAEPWHWECPLSLRAWTTGESDYDIG